MNFVLDEINFIYMSVFIPGCRDVSHPTRVEFISPMLTLHYILSRKDCLHGVFRHVLSREDISSRSVLRTGMKSSQDEFILGRNPVDSNKKMTKLNTEMNSSRGESHPGTKTLMKRVPYLDYQADVLCCRVGRYCFCFNTISILFFTG